MSAIDQDHEPAFARGIAGPLGKLTEDLKTKVDPLTHELFLQHCAMNGTSPSAMMRNFAYHVVHGKTWDVMVAERMLHEDKRISALTKLTGPFQGPESDFGSQVAP